MFDIFDSKNFFIPVLTSELTRIERVYQFLIVWNFRALLTNIKIQNVKVVNFRQKGVEKSYVTVEKVFHTYGIISTDCSLISIIKKIVNINN